MRNKPKINKQTLITSRQVINEKAQSLVQPGLDLRASWKDGRSRGRLKKRLFSVAFSLANITVVVVLVGYIWTSSNQQSDSTVLNSSGFSEEAASRPLDQISSADIAVNLAQLSRLEESITISNQADSYTYLTAISPSDPTIAPKPRTINSTVKTLNDITTYVVKSGDTVNSVADKFNLSADSIRWSNGISGNGLTAGKSLRIPPAGLNGIVYTVKAGDSITSLAKKYSITEDNIINFNDLEDREVTKGEEIFLLGGKQPAAPQPTRTTATTARFAFGSSPIYGGNGYAYGHCTYYVASKRAVPRNWGNARTWDEGARASGYTVSTKPIVGSIAQRDSGYFGYGHVAIVEKISDDGGQVYISEMNGPAGWNVVGYRWVPTNTYRYIY